MERSVLLNFVFFSINPAFDVYRVSDTWPKLCTCFCEVVLFRRLTFDYLPGSVIGFPQSTQQFVYFNRYVPICGLRTMITDHLSSQD